MTQSKISPPENIPQNNRARDVYRYSLITAGVMAAATVAIRYLFGAPPNYYDVNYWAGVISLFALLCAWLSKRGQIDLGLGLLIASIQAAIIIPSIKNDGLAVAFSAVGVISTFSFSYLIKSRKLAIFTNFASLAIAALLLSLDFFRPLERIPNTDVVSTWIVAGGVILVYLAIIARQAWGRSIRNKFLVSIIGTAGLAVMVLGIFVFYRSQQSQKFWSSELQNTIEQQSRQQLIDTAKFQASAANQSLSKITTSVKQLANYRTTLYAESTLLNQNSYWDGNTKLAQLPGGQYGNSASEPASVFIPNIVTPDQALFNDLNASMYLDFLAPAALKENFQMAALYYISANNFSVYYPNIDLAGNVPPDFNVLSQIFYTIATPENDPQRKAVWSVPYQDPAGTGLIVTNSMPVYDKNDKFRGVMSADVQLSKVAAEITVAKFGKSGFAFLIDQAGHIVTMHESGYKLFGIQPEIVAVSESPKSTLLGLGSSDLQNVTRRMTAGESGAATIIIQDTQYYLAYAPLPTIGYSIGLIAPTAELDVAYLVALEQIGNETQSSTSLSLVIALVLLLVAIGVSIFLSRYVTAPLIQLTKIANEVSQGNLGIQAEAQTNDEVGVLAGTFNIMTAQLRETFATLEQRVADRTRNLELAAEVGRTVSQVRALDVMLKDATELIRKQFDLYYVQIYLVNSSQTYLNLQAGTGQVGEQLLERSHRLAIDLDSINGRAAIEKKSVVISDTTSSTTFKPNPLLPNTQSEMAVPLLIGDRAVGVLDIQSEHKGSLSQNELPAFEALAGQIAVAIQNANLLAETEQARAEVEKQAASLVRTNWQDYQDAVHQPESTGFIFDHNKVIPFTEAEEQSQPNADNSFNAPVAITGETLGMLTVNMGRQSLDSQQEDLANAVARQVAQRIEALRLVESAERYRAEAEAASRRLTREAWKSHAENVGGHPKYFYDLKEVRPFNYSKADDSATSVPLKVRDEVIGKLGIHGLDPNDQASLELVNATVERLGAHIESLRQFDQTQSALTLSEKLFEASRELAQSPDLQGLIKASVTSLDIPEIDRAILGALQYDPEGNLEGMTIIANWSSQEEPQATPVGTHYSKEVLNTISLFSSPEPLFFDDMLQDERVDAATLGIAKYLNYRAVAALPLYVGKRQDAILLFEGEKPHHFTQAEIQLFAALAPQIATVTENRRQFERAQQQAEREAALNVISQKIQNATSVDDVLQIAARELGSALGAVRVSANIQTTQQDAANVNKN